MKDFWRGFGFGFLACCILAMFFTVPIWVAKGQVEKQRCAGVWLRATTVADTLAAIRQHCPEVSR